MESKKLNSDSKIKSLEPDRLDIFGTKFSIVDLESSVKLLTAGKFPKPGYVCFPSTSMIYHATEENSLQNVYNESTLTVADGKFTEYYSRLKKCVDLKNVSGYWLLDHLLKTDHTHFFYGTDSVTLNKLKENLLNNYPSARILGYKSPPFVNLDTIYPHKCIIEDFREINNLNPDFIWIGISSPKQDYLMYHYRKYLANSVMLGVGAVFLYYAGTLKKGPEILKKMSLRWVYRLIQQPKTVIKRNSALPGIAGFIKLIIKHDIMGKRFFNYNGIIK